MAMELVTALAAMKTGIELAHTALDARDDRRAREAVGEISRKMADVNISALGMSERLLAMQAKLEEATEKLAAAEKRLAERDKYVLRAVGRGLFAYAFEPAEGDSTPPHYKCQICHDRGESSILAPNENGNYLQCRIDSKHGLLIGPPAPFVMPKPVRGLAR